MMEFVHRRPPGKGLGTKLGQECERPCGTDLRQLYDMSVPTDMPILGVRVLGSRGVGHKMVQHDGCDNLACGITLGMRRIE